MSTNTQGPTSPSVIVLLAIIPILPLSMMVTVILATQYFIDDVTIALGLLGAVFVVLLDLFLLVYLVGAKLREGKIAEAVKRGLLLIGLGLLIAPAVAVLPWSLGWLYNSSPWIPFLLPALFVVGVIAMLVLAWKAPRERRRSTLELLACWVCVAAITDNLVPWPLKDFLALLLIVGLTWKAFTVWKLRRARVSAVGSA